MARLRVSPTRSNLMRYRDDLEMAQVGHSLLDRKREVLSTNLMEVAQKAQEAQALVAALLSEAYGSLRVANLTMGREMVEWAALATETKAEISVLLRSVMGVVVPDIELEIESPELAFGLGDTTAALDEAQLRFRHVLELIPHLAETVSAVWRLASELQRTQRRVNALEYLFIPQLSDTVKYIEETLEERDREERYRLKRVKDITSEDARP